MPTPTVPDSNDFCECGTPLAYATGIEIYCPRKGCEFEEAKVREVLVSWGLEKVLETPQRPSWDDWGLNLARAVATRADCRRAQHGAVILSSAHRVCSTGYNGYPKGQRGCLAGGCPRGALSADELPHLAPYNEGVGRCDAIHAEANALLHADWASVQGGIMYITGQPCHGCLVLIKGSGLVAARWPTGYWVQGE